MATQPLKLTRRGEIVRDVLIGVGIGLGALSILALGIMFGGR